MERISGYALLIIGLALLILPAILALVLFLGGLHAPQLFPTPTVQQDALANALANFSNVCLIFFVLAIIVWTGSIISSRAVAMIKDVRLKLVRRSLREVADVAEKIGKEES